MKTYSRWVGIAVLVGSWGLLSAEAREAPISPQKLAATEKKVERVKALTQSLPRPQRQGLSGGLQNLIVLAERWNKITLNLTQQSTGIGREIELPVLAPAPLSAPQQVSDPSTDVGFSSFAGFTQSETSTAWCGDNLVVGFNDTGSFFESLSSGPGGVSFNGLARSTNKGASFSDLGFLNPGSDVNNMLGGDPVLACTDAHTFYYASIFLTFSTSAISVSKSTDGGLTFGDPVVTVEKDIFHLLDKPWMAVDPTNTNRLYVTYTDSDFSGASAACGFQSRTAIELVSSTNGGTTWSAPVVIVEVCGLPFVQGSQVAVGPGGEVYVAWETLADLFTREIDIRRSTTNGVSFGPTVKVDTVTPVGDGFLLQGGFRAPLNFPSLAVDLSASPTRGNVYIAWHDGRHLSLPDAVSGVYRYADVLLSRSTSGGARWSSPVRVNNKVKPPKGSGTDQYQPGIAVDNSTGRVGVCFYDRRRDSLNFLIDRFCAGSTNAGASWSNLQITTVNFAAVPGQDFLASLVYMGDYDSVASDFTRVNSGFVGAFGDNSRGNPDVKANQF
jgi:hypothetical protein